VLSEKDIRRLLDLLNAELRKSGVKGELYLVGGAVMCIAFHARPATRDIDGFFVPARQVREAAARVASETGLEAGWLNDAVKGYLSDQGDFAPFLELDHLRVMVARPQYLLAMKCLAMRIGQEFHDEEDVRYLLRHLDISTFDAAVGVISRFYPLERFPQKTLYALQDLLGPTEKDIRAPSPKS
jgi:hypothetical protein